MMPGKLHVLISFLLLLSACTVKKETIANAEKDTKTLNPEVLEYNFQPDSPDVYLVEDLDEKPRFPGCEDKLDLVEKEECASHKFLMVFYKSLKYPAEARENGIKGTVISSFVIGRDGYIRDIKIRQDIGEGCGEAVRKCILKLNDNPEPWIPGKKDGKAVKTMIVMPIKFKL